jgi:hypothetical protein
MSEVGCLRDAHFINVQCSELTVHNEARGDTTDVVAITHENMPADDQLHGAVRIANCVDAGGYDTGVSTEADFSLGGINLTQFNTGLNLFSWNDGGIQSALPGLDSQFIAGKGVDISGVQTEDRGISYLLSLPTRAIVTRGGQGPHPHIVSHGGEHYSIPVECSRAIHGSNGLLDYSKTLFTKMGGMVTSPPEFITDTSPHRHSTAGTRFAIDSTAGTGVNAGAYTDSEHEAKAFSVTFVVEIPDVLGTDQCMFGVRKIYDWTNATSSVAADVGTVDVVADAQPFLSNGKAYTDFAAININGGVIEMVANDSTGATTTAVSAPADQIPFANNQVWEFNITVSDPAQDQVAPGTIEFRMRNRTLGKHRALCVPATDAHLVKLRSGVYTPFMQVRQDTSLTPIYLRSITWDGGWNIL